MPSRQLTPILAALFVFVSADRCVASPLFAAPFQSFDAGDGPSSIAAGDLNGDGEPDLAVANSRSNTVSVLLGSGTEDSGCREVGAGLVR